MSKQRGIGIVLQYIQMGLSILISLVYTPIMLRILGQNEYGIYNISFSVISYLNIISLGFGASYIRYYSIYKKSNDADGLKRLNGLYLSVFSFMGVVALVFGLFFSLNIQWFFNETYSPNEIYIARILMIFMAINMALSFPFSFFTSYVTSQEKFIFQKLLNMGKTVFSPIFSIFLLYFGYGSIGMIAAITLTSLTVDLINVIYCFGKLKLKISFKKIEWKLVRSIFVFSIFIAINQIIDQINWQTDKVILGRMINGAAVAIYAVGANINTMYLQFSTAISTVYTPKIHSIVNSDSTEKEKNATLTRLFINVGRIQWFVICLVLTGFIFYGRFFITKWAGPEYADSYYVALLLICPVTIALIQNVGIEIQRAKNMHRFRSVVYSIMAFLNIGISILFAYMWGTIGVALGTTISLIVANGIIMNIYYHKKMGINMILFWKSILSTIPAITIPLVFGITISRIHAISSLLDFLIIIVVYSIVYCAAIYFFALNYSEKAFIKSILKRITKMKQK